MTRLVTLLAIIGIALILWHKISRASGAERKRLVFWSIFGTIVAILAGLAVTGHLNVITAAIAGLVALLPRALQLLKYLPFLSRMYQQGRPGGQQANTPPPQGGRSMSTEEAMEVLGIKPGSSREQVIQVYRRMMQKVHPDRVGSDYLAAQINRAKETLLG